MLQPLPLILGFPGPRLEEEDKAHLTRCRPAGVILFARNIQSIPQLQGLIKELKALLGDILICIDHEGGRVDRFQGLAPSPPAPFDLAKGGNRELVKQGAALQAELLAHVGINCNFSPLLDLYDPASPVIGDRAYAAEPELVAEHAFTQILEHRTWGILPVCKHFPGHGRSHQDSHFEAARLEGDLADFAERDLLPFLLACQAEVPAMMSAHLWVPALDPRHPATLSPAILGELLRGQLGYRGLLFSDCLEMAATAEAYSPQAMVDLGCEAGLDYFVSSFSLKKSRGFQVELAQALEAKRLIAPPLPQLARPAAPALPPWEQAFALWSQVLEDSQPGPLHTSGLLLLHEGLLTQQGVNQGESSPWLQRFDHSNLPLVEVLPASLETWELALNRARQEGLTLVWLDRLGAGSVIGELLSSALARNLPLPNLLHLDLATRPSPHAGPWRKMRLPGVNQTGAKFLIQRLESLVQRV